MDKVYKANAVLSRNSGAKNRLISWQAYAKMIHLFKADDEAAMKRKWVNNLPEIPRPTLQSRRRMDFDVCSSILNVLFRESS